MLSRFSKSVAVLAVAAATATGSFAADITSIVPVHQNGRVVYTNEDSPAVLQRQSSSAAAPVRTSHLEYWSNTEHRWKPVPRPTPSAMRAARSAVQEVASFVGTKPAATQSASAPMDPNYQSIARGRFVTSAEVDSAIEQAASRHGVDPNLVRALVKVESNFNPRAVSKKGAMGLMQLMPATARGLNVTNPFDPQQNVDAGVRHLKGLLDSFNGNVSLSLAAYNAGAGAVARHHGVPEFAETKNYVRQITNIYTAGGPVTSFQSIHRAAPIHAERDAAGMLRLSNDE
jgi:soluble lytic murein transglycosylase-like protein